MTAGWRKSSYSGGNGGDCIEAGSRPGAVLIRDTRQDGAGPILAFTPQAWHQFTRQVSQAA